MATVVDVDVAPLEPDVLGSVTSFVDCVVVVCALASLEPRSVVELSVTTLCVLVFTTVLVLASPDDGVVDGMVTLPPPPVLGVVAVVVCLAVELVDGGVSPVVAGGGVVDGGVSVVVVGGGVVG